MRFIALILVVLGICAAAGADVAPPADLALSSLEFTAATNLSAVTVRGKSTEMVGQASFDPKGALAKVDATVSVESLKTGMEMRDHHMRERVFKTADGKYPPLHFASTAVTCASQTACQVTGPLEIRGVAKGAVFACTVSEGNRSADCSATIKLSTYGIERPTQLGVTVVDDVPIHLVVTRK